MRKFLLLLCALLGTVGAWATDVVISDRTNTVASGSVTTTNEHKYGTYSNAAGGTSFTTNEASGMAGVTVTVDASIMRAAWFSNASYLYVMGFNPADTDEHTITISAPDGYKVTGYSITAISTSVNRKFTVTPDGDTPSANNVSAPGLTTFNKTGLDSQTAKITIQAATSATGNFLCFPLFSVTVVSATAKLVNVTYELYESDGTTLVSTVEKEQEEKSAIDVPASLTAATYYNYSTEGTIGDSDCTIKVIRTLKEGHVISLDGFSNSKCYNIRNNRGTWAVGSGATVVNSTVELGLAFMASDTKQQFAFITYEDKVYLYSVSEGKFAYVNGTKLSLTADVTSAVEASPVTLQSSTSSFKNSEPVIITVAGNHFGVSTGFSPDIYKYQSQGDGGNCASITEAGSFDATAALAALEAYFHPAYTVTYRVLDPENNVLFTSSAIPASLGDVITELPNEYRLDLYTYSTVNKTIEEQETIIDFTATWNGPFVFSTDFTSATWYYTFERTSTQLYYSESGITTSTNATANSEKWAIIGNPYNNPYSGLKVKVINGAAGEGIYLTHSAATLSWSETATDWTMTAHPYDKNGILLYDVVNNSTYSIYLGSNGAVTALNAVVTAGNDSNKGGCIEFIAVPTDYSNMVAANITPYFSVLDVYYGITTSDANTLKSTYAYWDGETACTESEYNTLYNAVMAAVVYPESGKYYRIKNFSTNNYLGKVTENAETFENGTTPSTVVYMTENAGVYTWNIQGADAYKTLTLVHSAPGLFTASTGAGTYHYLRDTDGEITEWSAVSITDTPQAYWAIEDAEDVTLSLNAIDGKSYATTYLPFGVNLDGDVKAYALTEQTFGAENYAVPAEIGQAVPAGSAVMLVSESGATSVTATIDNTIPANNIANSLQGSYFASTPSAYVLNALNGEVGFYALNGTLAANRAYLPKTNEVKGFRIMWGNTDAITSVDAKQDAKNATIYNLAGQRVNAAQKGVFIVNGKKVVLK